METTFQFDRRKAVEIILYISNQCSDLYKTLKIIWFADKHHLGKYGRSISGDWFAALDWGPVPDNIYGIIKAVRGDGLYEIDQSVQESFQILDQTTIKPLRPPNLDFLSESDIECLDWSIREYAPKTFDELHDLSRNEPSFQKAGRIGKISLKDIVMSLPNSTALWDYLNDQ